ncbi:hypothetical protein QA601_13560 [Chitinispirillales bacterium ANBcel5]|uniref:hypothetical protein n=1 Tax=Cellulosispirillum alkaliphilum TaxID=3039283 RepID=UPI002A55634A|nr:hypothetical protein [Chitinispirillales bacterium ANBcel5]
MKPVKTLLLIVCSLSLFTFISCTNVASGTETGNPVITELAFALFDVIDSTDQWEPQHYLVDGTEQLDPARIYQDFGGVVLAKQAQTLSTEQEKEFKVIEREDTVIYSIPIIIADTLIEFSDTTQLLINDSGDSVYLSRSYRNEIIITDTISVFDTVTVISYDTLYLDGESGRSSPIEIVTGSANHEGTVINKDGSVSYSILMSYRHASYSSMMPSSPHLIIHQADNLMSLSREYKQDGVAIVEQYSGYEPQDTIFSKRTYSSTQYALLNASYTTPATSINLDVLFCNGEDYNFQNTSNNNIYTLERKISENGSIREKVLFGVDDENARSLSTQISKYFPSDTKRRSYNTHYFLKGDTEKPGHHHLALAAMKQSRVYSQGEVDEMHIEFSFETELKRSQSATNAKVSARVVSAREVESIFEGRIDRSSGTAIGVLEMDGKDYAVRLFRSGTFIMDEIVR